MFDLILAGNGLSVAIAGFLLGGVLVLLHEVLFRLYLCRDYPNVDNPTELLLTRNPGGMVDFSGIPRLTQNFRFAIMILMVVIVLGMIWNAVDLVLMGIAWLFNGGD